MGEGVGGEVDLGGVGVGVGPAPAHLAFDESLVPGCVSCFVLQCWGKESGGWNVSAEIGG